MNNLHYYYNVKYLEDIVNKNSSDVNKELLKAINSNDVLQESIELTKEIRKIPHIQSFELVATYPGLLFGSGYPHLSGEKVDGELQIGFNFDYTSGVPYYPGSSLKGVIRHIIKLAKQNVDLANFITDGKIDINELDESFKDGDVFIGAYITGVHKDTDVYKDNGKLMGIDYITPHPGELKNPVPIPFIRINPNVVLEFFFIFKEYSDTKLKVYKKIITEFGIGAKTNVGYGRMHECKGEITRYISNQEEEDTYGKVNSNQKNKGNSNYNGKNTTYGKKRKPQY